VIAATPRAKIVRLDLQGDPFSYLPGQAVLVAAHGQGPRRPYSIAAAPEDARHDGWLELLMGVDAQPSPSSQQPSGEPQVSHESSPAGAVPLERGDFVDVEGPVGRFTFPSDPAEGRFVFIAGGTGIAPLRAMLRHALHIRHHRIGLLYSARAAGEFAYESELRALASEGRIELRQTVTRDVGPDEWMGARGRIGVNDLAPLVHDPATLCFVCGPPALVEEIPKLLGTLGVTRQRIRVEEWE
jgi:ferredoxin-NADP reductase